MPRTLSRTIGNVSLTSTNRSSSSVSIDSAFYETNLNTDTITVACWAKVMTRDTGFLVAKRNTSGQFRCYALELPVANGFRFTIVNNTGPTAVVTATGTTQRHLGEWVHVLGRYDGVNVEIWVNGVMEDQQPQTDVIFQANDQHRIASLDSASTLVGRIKNVYIWNVALTDNEIAALYTDGTVPSSGLLGAYDMENGTGSLTDLSGNGNTGTVASPMHYIHDVPMAHQNLFSNLVWNGDFEYAPTGAVATNTASRRIDGTAAGSTSFNTPFGNWITSVNFTSGTALFDTAEKHGGSYSLKIAASSAVGGTSGHTVSTTTTVSPSVADQYFHMIPIKPSTAYTMTGWVKTSAITNNNPGATNGVTMRVFQYSGVSTSSLVSNASGNFTGTNDWTQVTISFTSNASAKFANIWCTLYNETGDCWFDDITLVEDAPDRGLATRSDLATRTLIS